MSNPTQIFPSVQTPTASENRPSDRWRPGPHPDPDTDLALKTAYDSIYGLEHRSAQTPEPLNGSTMSCGAITVTGQLKGVATGLSTLSNVIVSIDAGAAPTNLTVTATPSTTVPGTFDVYVWKPTSASVNTPILNTVPTVVRWHAWGT